MAFHDTKVKKKLGKDVRSAILSSAEEAVISANIMQDIAFKLHSSIGGNHKIRVASGDPCDKTEMRHILGDWWDKELFQLTSREALQRLVAIFEDPDVDLRPLASQLKKKIGDVEQMEIEDEDGGDPSTSVLNEFGGVVRKHKKITFACCAAAIFLVVFLPVLFLVIIPNFQSDDPSGTNPGSNSTTESPESSTTTTTTAMPSTSTTTTITTTTTTTTTTPMFTLIWKYMTISPFTPTVTVPHMSS